jgi:hypothetical protein
MTKFVMPACVLLLVEKEVSRAHNGVVDRVGASVFFLAQLLLISHGRSSCSCSRLFCDAALASGCTCVVDKTRGNRNVKGVVRKGLV